MKDRFVYRKTWLPGSNGNRNQILQINPLLDLETNINGILLWDGSDFGLVNGRYGRKQVLFPQEAAAVRSRQRRYRQPRSPRIQAILKQAYELKDRLDKTPGLTRDALAEEKGFSPSYLTRILSMLNLAPAIQKYILALPPSVRVGPLTERSLRPLARSRDWDFQIKEFERLVHLNRKTSPVAA